MALIFRLFPVYLVILFLIQLIPVRINIFFRRENINDYINVSVNTFFSLLRFNVEVPVLRQETPADLIAETEIKAYGDNLLQKEVKKLSIFDIHQDTVRAVLSYLRNNKRVLWFMARFFARAVTIEKLVFMIRAGSGDAAVTGFLSGVCRTLAGTATVLIRRKMKVKNGPVFGVTPDFGPSPTFAAKLDSAVAFRIGHIAIGGFLFLTTVIRGGNK